MRLKAEWAIDSEPIQAQEIIVNKFNLWVTSHICAAYYYTFFSNMALKKQHKARWNCNMGKYQLGRGTWTAPQNGKWPYFNSESAKGSLHYRGSVLWNKILSEIRKLLSLNVFKTSIHGKDFSNTPWPIVTLIIHNVSFCIFNIIANSSLEYFSLVLNKIPRKTM